MVIFDTSVIIDASRRKKDALDLIESYLEKEQIATTVITKYEMLRGATEQDTNFVTKMLEQFIIYCFDDNSVKEAVTAYRKLNEKGKIINELDLLIAGIVAANSETLVTKDKDFLNLGSNRIIIMK